MRTRKSNFSDKEKTNAKAKALEILLYKTRTEKELFDKLIEKGYEEEESLDAIEYAKSFGYVNDEDYAKRYVKLNEDKKGRSAIKRELAQKGVQDAYIEYALMEIEDQMPAIRALIIKRAGEPHQMDEKEFRRVYGFLIRHGFSNSEAMKALKEYQSEET